MKAVILAAGEGTRMAPLTHSKPKVMVEVGNQPILEHLLQALTASGIRDITMVVGFKRERIMNHFGNGNRFGCTIGYAIQEHQLGTGHALFSGLEAMTCGDEPIFVVPGDNLVGIEGIRALVECTHENVLLTTTSRSSTKYGVVRSRGDTVISIEDRTVGHDEKLPISTGIIKLSAHSCKTISHWNTPAERSRSDRYDINNLTGLLNRYMAEHGTTDGSRAFRTVSTRNWSDVVEPWDLLFMNDFVIRSMGTRTGGIRDANVTIKGPVSIGSNTRIRSGTRIYGPVVIGRGCDIGPGTVIRSSTTIGDNVTIGSFTQIKNTIIFDNVDINMGCDIVNSVIGEGVVAGSNFVSSTFRGDTLEELGVIIGQDTVIHPKVVSAAGVKIGTQCVVEMAAKVTKDLPDGAWILG